MLEPLTLLLMVGAPEVFGHPTRARQIYSGYDDLAIALQEGEPPGLATEIPLITGQTPRTLSMRVGSYVVLPSRLERTLAALRKFAVNPITGDRSPAVDALAFLERVPQYLPAPKAAEAEDGLITLFWETPNFYADIEFRGDERFSVFTRNRTSGRDEVLDDAPLTEANGSWLSTYLEPLLPHGAEGNTA